MTRQQMFNTAYHGLAAQGFERSMRYNDGATCAYRGEGGKRCALGYLIPDAIYDPAWDSPDGALSAYGLAEKNINSAVCLKNQMFLLELQNAHDGSSSPQGMRLRLASVAKQFCLTIPELPDFKAETVERELVAAV